MIVTINSSVETVPTKERGKQAQCEIVCKISKKAPRLATGSIPTIYQEKETVKQNKSDTSQLGHLRPSVCRHESRAAVKAKGTLLWGQAPRKHSAPGCCGLSL